MTTKVAVVAGLLAELNKEAEILHVRDGALSEARAAYDVASRKYAAVRDMVAEYIGKNPYDESVEWPLEALQSVERSIVYTAHRFVHMRPGDAIALSLKEIKEPTALEDICDRLRNGGLPLPPRMVNAALMKTSGVNKTIEGRYFFVEEAPPPTEDVDDLPF